MKASVFASFCRRAAPGALALLLLLASQAPSSETAAADAPPAVRIAVAAFEGDRSGDDSFAARLAAQLAARRIERVVFPSELATLSVLDVRGSLPEAAQVRTLASDARVDNLVVGRASRTDNGQAVEVSVEVRSGHSGAVVARYERYTGRAAGGLDAAADELAGAILAGLGYTPESTDVSAPPPAASTRSKSRRLLASDEPITIQSDELEVIQQDDARHIIFDRNVLVTQGDVTLRSEKLDAYYSAGASQPDRLVATGRVRVSQGDRTGRCERAVYRRADQTLVCSGRAEVVQGCERLRGSKIEFDLARDRVRVTGAASVLIQPDAADGTSGCAEPSG